MMTTLYDLEGRPRHTFDVPGENLNERMGHAIYEAHTQNLPLGRTLDDEGNVSSKGMFLVGADLKGKKIRGITLTGSNLKGVDFRGADISAGWLDECQLQDALFGNRHKGHSARAKFANFKGSDLTDAEMYGDFEHAQFDELSVVQKLDMKLYQENKKGRFK